MSYVIFVRHAESLANKKGILNHDVEGFPLTHEGKIEAKKLAQDIGRLKIFRIYSSPVERARQTADCISEVSGVPVNTDERLMERNLGQFNNYPAKDGLWKYDMQDDPKGVEPWESLIKRATAFVDSAGKEPGITVAVTHDGVIKAFACGLYGLGDIESFAIKIPKPSITIVKVENGSSKVLALGLPMLTNKLLHELSTP